jgi:hypothetical protein
MNSIDNSVRLYPITCAMVQLWFVSQQLPRRLVPRVVIWEVMESFRSGAPWEILRLLGELSSEEINISSRTLRFVKTELLQKLAGPLNCYLTSCFEMWYLPPTCAPTIMALWTMRSTPELNQCGYHVFELPEMWAK